MMKIKTITCHEVYNYGASLQEFALLKYLTELGHDAEAINYRPAYLSNHFNLWAVSNPKYNQLFLKQLYLLMKLPQRILSLRRKKEFDKFSKNYIKSGEIIYRSNEDLKKNAPEADVYICGSDQIWNSFFQNGKDPAFYLDFAPEKKIKVSYAASFAIESISNDLKSFVKEKVDRIDHISVRENSGLTILKDVGIDRGVQVLDPVFLLNKDYWVNQFFTTINDKFIFVYDFDSNPLIRETALNLKKEKGFKIFTVNTNIRYADKNFNLKGPDFFLSLVYHSQLVLTNSFHALAFSLIFEKQFKIFERQESINTRMRDLLKLVNLENCLYSDSNNQDDANFIKYEQVRVILNKEIKRSKLFLEKALKGS